MSIPSAKNKSFRHLLEAAVVIQPSRLIEEGRIAIVTNVERGMRWPLCCAQTTCIDADGEAVWS